MKIVVNAFSAKIGGGKTYLHNLLQNLPQEDLQVYIFGYDDLESLQTESVRRVRTSFPVYNPLLRLLWEYFILPRWLSKLGADILFCPGGLVNTKAPKNCRVVTMFRNMLPFDDQALAIATSPRLRLKNYLLKKRMLSSMASADLVIFISEYARCVIEKKIKVKNAVTIAHGIGDPFFVADKFLTRPPLPFEQKYILYVSRFEFYKRHLELVQAYARLSQDLRDEYKLLIVGGGDGLVAKKVDDFIVDNKLSSDVYVLGEYKYSELPALYKNASLFTFVSACENCPNILLEAMGAGLPIISSSYDPMPEFGGDAVMYASPEDPDQLALSIASALSDPQMLATHSDKVAIRAKSFKWSKTAELTWASLFKVGRP